MTKRIAAFIRTGWTTNIIWQYVTVPVVVICASLALVALQLHLTETNTSFLYLLIVLFCATTTRPSVTILCGFISFLCYDFLFIPPVFDLVPVNPGKLLDPFGFLVVALVTAPLAERSRQNAVEKAIYREAGEFRTTILRLVSHNLRTPLATIKTAITSLILMPNHSETTTELLNDANLECDRLNRLIGNVLQISRLDAKAIRFNADWNGLDEVVSSVFSRWRGEQKAGLLSASIPASLPLYYFDFELIENVLSNLVENAFRHGKPPVHVAIEPRPNEVWISIRDSGSGISEKAGGELFSAFSSLNPKAGGLGLGLTVCKGLVEAHKGRIWLDFDAQHTTFIFSLPIVEEETHESPAGRG